jgi:hypothetical protein
VLVVEAERLRREDRAADRGLRQAVAIACSSTKAPTSRTESESLRA